MADAATVKYLLRRGYLSPSELGLGPGTAPEGGGTPVARTALAFPPASLMQPAPARLEKAASQDWVLQIAAVTDGVRQGKMNVTLEVTLEPNSFTTTVVDARIGAYSALILMPLTATAVAAVSAGEVGVFGQKSGEARIAHANSANATRTFRMVILG